MRNPVTLLSRLLTAMLLIPALPANAGDDDLVVTIGYLQWQPDQGPVLSNVIPEPEDAGLQGAELAISDNNTTGRFLNQHYNLQPAIVNSEADALAAMDSLLNKGIRLFVVRAPADTLLALTEKAGEQALVFNAGAHDNALRQSECPTQLLHTIPSYAMLTDALAQWLNLRRWRDVLMITGPTDADQQWAASFRRAAQRFGIEIVDEKPWTFDADLRRTASRELPLFTQTDDDYDAVVVADVRGDFGEYVPFNTWLPRPVVGTQGMTPLTWHRVVESWGAAQLQSRFDEQAGRAMNSEDYAAWAAVRSIGTAVTRLGNSDATGVRDFLFSDNFQLAAFKGRKLSYRNWNGQLRQPIPLVHPRGLVATAPVEGFIHPKTEMDTLGLDEPESNCNIQP